MQLKINRTYHAPANVAQDLQSELDKRLLEGSKRATGVWDRIIEL